MKIRLGDLRRLIREALGSGGGDLALYVWYPAGDRIKIVLYSSTELLALDWSDRSELPPGIVKGYAGFHEPVEPCNDAWSVSSIAGIGYGDLLYGLGYSLVPTGRLMPDRMVTLRRARSWWRKEAGKEAEKVKSFPLDDFFVPQEKRLTPDYPDDDCELQKSMKKGGPDPLLDRAYEGVGVDPAPMRAVHHDAVKKLMRILNDLGGEYTSEEDVDEVLGDMLKSAATKHFTTEFEKYYRER